MRKVGRFTAALMLIGVGAVVIADQYLGTHWTQVLIHWWPLLFIFLGLEYIGYNMKYGESDKTLKLDIGGVIFAVLISAVVIGSTQSESFIKSGWGQFAQGQPHDNGTTNIAVPSGTERIAVENPSGNVTVRSGNVDQLQIQTTVYVPEGDEEKSREIIEQSSLESSSHGNILRIAANGKEYGGFWGKRSARMDMVITLPERTQGSIDLDLELTNGSITAEKISLKRELKGSSTNGTIQVNDVTADIDLESTNAKINVSNTKGNMKLQTTNGSIEAKGHKGDIRLQSTNGEFTLAGIAGAVTAETTNGNIQLGDAAAAVKAKTTNGTINVISKSVNGDWKLETTHGTIEVALPSVGDFNIRGEGKSISNQSSLPLRVDRKEVSGKVGTGKYNLYMDTSGSIAIRSAE
jgi:DUF4097 and DUF4098 domain-containing protein YvlB